MKASNVFLDALVSSAKAAHWQLYLELFGSRIGG